MQFLYFIRVKSQFVQAFEDKLMNLVGVFRCEQVLVEGHPAKIERDFRGPNIEHTMLIVHVRGDKDVHEVDQLLGAGKILGALYHYECYKVE